MKSKLEANFNPTDRIETWDDSYYVYLLFGPAGDRIKQAWIEIEPNLPFSEVQRILSTITLPDKDFTLLVAPGKFLAVNAEHIFPWPEAKEVLKPQEIMESAINLLMPDFVALIESTLQRLENMTFAERDALLTQKLGDYLVMPSPYNMISLYMQEMYDELGSKVQQTDITNFQSLAQLVLQILPYVSPKSMFYRQEYSPTEAMDAGFASLATHWRSLRYIFQENSSLVGEILEALEKKIHRQDAQEVLLQNYESISDILWKFLRIGHNGFVGRTIIGHGEFTVTLDSNCKLQFEISGLAKAERQQQTAKTVALWSALNSAADMVSESLRNSKVRLAFGQRGLHKTREQKRCPVTERKAYDYQLRIALILLDTYVTAKKINNGEEI